MFAFEVKVDPKDSEIRNVCLHVKTENTKYKFEPLASLPRFEKIDVTVGSCILDFDTEDCTTLLEWDEKKVRMSMSGFHGSSEYEIEKVDDSLQQALTEWIEYEKAESLFDADESIIRYREKNALGAIKQKSAILKAKEINEETAIRNKTQFELDQLLETRIAQIAKKQKTLRK